jgi:hypothetical protein
MLLHMHMLISNKRGSIEMHFFCLLLFSSCFDTHSVVCYTHQIVDFNSVMVSILILYLVGPELKQSQRLTVMTRSFIVFLSPSK